MKKLSMFFAILFASVMSFAAEVTVTKTVAECVPAGIGNGTQVGDLFADDVLSVTTNADGNNGKIYQTGTEWRLYQTNNGVVTVAVKEGTLKSVKFTFTVTNTGAFFNGETQITSGEAVTVSGQSAEFKVGNSGTAANGQVRVTAFEVVYETAGGETPGEETLTPATYNFDAVTYTTEGTVIDPAVTATFTYSVTRNADKTLTINFASDVAIVGLVPQLHVGEAYVGLTDKGGNTWTLTTTDIYEDGTVITGELYLAYAGAAKALPFTYTVGSVNETTPVVTEYAITVAETTNGTVVASAEKAKEGDEVTLTITPAEGYELDALEVKAGEEVVAVADNKFTMPAAAVVVTVTFKQKETPVVTDGKVITFADADKDGSVVITSLEGLVLTGANLVTFGSADKVYTGTTGLKLGSSSANGTLTLNLVEKAKATTIVVKAAAWVNNSGKVDAASLSVNGLEAQTLTQELADYTFAVNEEIEAITLAATKRLYVKSITINDGEVPDKPVVITPATYYTLESFTTEGTVIDPALDVNVITSITRNADKTLTFAVELDTEVTSLVPQVRYAEVGFTNMTENALTTTATFEDGETVTGEFYLAYAGGAKGFAFTYTVGSSNDKPSFPAAAPKELTVAEAVAACTTTESTEEYIIKGYVTKVRYTYTVANGISLDIADEEGGTPTIYIFKATPVDEAAQGASVGDFVQVKGKIVLYNSTPEVSQGAELSIITKAAPAQELGAISIAEFLTKADTKNIYTLTGVVSNIVNTTYGNFTLVDAEDEEVSVYIYGLLTADGVAKQFESMGIEEGDTLTLKGTYKLYNGTPEIENAIFVSLIKGEGQIEEPTEYELTPNVGYIEWVDEYEQYYIEFMNISANGDTLQSAYIWLNGTEDAMPEGTYTSKDFDLEYLYLADEELGAYSSTYYGEEYPFASMDMTITWGEAVKGEVMSYTPEEDAETIYYRIDVIPATISFTATDYLGQVYVVKNAVVAVEQIVIVENPGTETSLQKVNAEQLNGKIYNVLGQEVDSNYRGIIIRDGKKYLAK